MATCAWCERETEGVNGSHTICDGCLAWLYPEPQNVPAWQAVWQAFSPLAWGMATVTLGALLGWLLVGCDGHIDPECRDAYDAATTCDEFNEAADICGPPTSGSSSYFFAQCPGLPRP